MSEHIKQYWELQAKNHEDSHWASWGDNWMIDLEIQAIGEHILPGSKVIDIGCANGYSAFKQYDLRKPESIVGIDFARNMIEFANKSLDSRTGPSNLTFEVGDIRSLDFVDASFDVAYTTRVLINLPTWEEQKRAISECLRVVKPGGKLVLSEGFWEPLCKLNAVRLLCNLPPLVEHDFNRYIKFDHLRRYLESLTVNYKINDFSSIYYLGSRLLRELITNPEEFQGFSNPVNELFFNIEQQYSGGGFGIQQAVIIDKI
jgi:ubiquinone/menaquinone biosynthesis C-methylase UbiE